MGDDEVPDEVTTVPPVVESEAGSAVVDHPSKHCDDCGSDNPRGFWWDTAAQWIMAFFAFLGVGLSGWAVVLLKGTLSATRDAVTEAKNATNAAQDSVGITREIGQAQSRGYLTAKEAKFSSDVNHAACQICIENTGQSPAEILEIIGTLKVHKLGPDGEPDPKERYELLTSDLLPRLSISGRSQANTAIFWDAANQPDFADAMNIIRGGKPFFVDVRVVYSDIFQETHEIHLRVTTLNDDSIYDRFEGNATHRAGVGIRSHTYKRIQKP